MAKVITDQDLGDNLEIINKKLQVKQSFVIKSKIYAYGELAIFKIETNTNNSILQPGDFCMGFVQGQFINAQYVSGDPKLLASFNI